MENVRTWPWLSCFQDRTGDPGVSTPSPAPTPTLPFPEGLLGPLLPGFSLRIHSFMDSELGPFSTGYPACMAPWDLGGSSVGPAAPLL